MKIHENIPVMVGSEEKRARVEEYSRGGTKSPSLDIIIVDGVRYTPYGARRAKIRITMIGVMKIIYRDRMKDLIYSKNPFLALM